MNKTDDWLPTDKNIEVYLLHSKMLVALAEEIRELSKKKQEGTLNLTKVRMVNRVLLPLKEEILAQVPAHIFLDLLDEDLLPNNSDAVLIISQYEAAIKEFREIYRRSIRIDVYNSHAYWATVEDPDGTRTLEEKYDEDEDEDDS